MTINATQFCGGKKVEKPTMEGNKLYHEVKNGTMVGYLAHKDDKTASKPLGRIAIRPHVAEDGHRIYRAEAQNNVFGKGAGDGLHKAAHDWSMKHFPAKDNTFYDRHPNVYKESPGTRPQHTMGHIDHPSKLDKGGIAKYVKRTKSSGMPSSHYDHIVNNHPRHRSELEYDHRGPVDKSESSFIKDMKPDRIEETGPVKKANKAKKNTSSMEKGIMQPKGNAGPRQRDSSQKARANAKKGNEAQAAGEAHFKSMGRDASKSESTIARAMRVMKSKDEAIMGDVAKAVGKQVKTNVSSLAKYAAKKIKSGVPKAAKAIVYHAGKATAHLIAAGDRYDARRMKDKAAKASATKATAEKKPQAESTTARAMRVMSEAKLTAARDAVIAKADKQANADIGAGSTEVGPGDYMASGKDMLKVVAGMKLKKRVNKVKAKVEAQEYANNWLSDMENLEEGNPLAVMHKHQEAGRHFVAISTERPGLSKKEVKTRNKELVSHARKAGYGVRKVEGHYEGTKETSHIIHAKAPGKESGAELVAFGRKMGHKYDQDSVLHHNGKSARLVGTNKTGYPGKGNADKVGGKLKFNNPASPFQTEMRPGKKKSPARFTT
jgi:hypothetical protein